MSLEIAVHPAGYEHEAYIRRTWFGELWKLLTPRPREQDYARWMPDRIGEAMPGVAVATPPDDAWTVLGWLAVDDGVILMGYVVPSLRRAGVFTRLRSELLGAIGPWAVACPPGPLSERYRYVGGAW